MVLIAAPSTGLMGENLRATHSYIYVANYSDATISMYSQNSAGALQHLTPGVVALPFAPHDIKVHPNGKYAYATAWDNPNNSVAIFRIESNGNLTKIDSPSIKGPKCQQSFFIDALGQWAYAASFSRSCGSGIYIYEIKENGLLELKNEVMEYSGSYSSGPAIPFAGGVIYAAVPHASQLMKATSNDSRGQYSVQAVGKNQGLHNIDLLFAEEHRKYLIAASEVSGNVSVYASGCKLFCEPKLMKWWFDGVVGKLALMHGEILYINTWNGVARLNLSDGTELPVIFFDDGPVNGMQIHPTGQYIYSTRFDGSLSVHDLRGGNKSPPILISKVKTGRTPHGIGIVWLP